VRNVFMKHHADFFDPALWQKHKEQILNGELAEFFPYERSIRFCVRYPERFLSGAPAARAA
jgi:isocitrate dehydrogenase kinase/phosphatase